MAYLEHIESPSDLKRLKETELPILCKEIRDFLEETLFQTGGHFSSNLGVVELTVALHYLFDFLQDRLIFDVSHQSYVHKILTGRKKLFPTLRQYQGLSGYTHPKESPYDHFLFAHAGTAISTSLGISLADQFQNHKGKTIALVGDASIATGIALESLNHLGETRKGLLVILNDNSMSISKSVGSLSEYLTKLRVNTCYSELKRDVRFVLNRFPNWGSKIQQLITKALKRIPRYLVSGLLFQELGLDYYGPVDGHNLPLLLKLFRNIRFQDRPILLHVVTEKGKGHYKAIEDPEKYHGISGTPNISSISPSSNSNNPIPNSSKELNHSDPVSHRTFSHNSNTNSMNSSLDHSNGDSNQSKDQDRNSAKKNSIKKNSISFTEAFSQSIVELGQEDDRIVGITAAMPSGTGLKAFGKRFPDRYFDVGICEQHGVAMAAGMSRGGLFPVCAIYSTFLQRAYDQIFQEVCLNENHVVFCMDRAGIAGQDGATHAGVFDLAYLRTFPGIVLVAPRNSYELKEMLRFALYQVKGPVAIRYPRDSCLEPFDSKGFEPIRLGKASVLKQGKDLTLLGYGVMTQVLLEVSEILFAKEGISAEVIDARFAKPLDQEMLTRILTKKTPIFTLEDHMLQGGFGSAVLEMVNQLGQDSSSIHLLGIRDQFVEHGSRAEILQIHRLDKINVSEFVLQSIQHPIGRTKTSQSSTVSYLKTR